MIKFLTLKKLLFNTDFRSAVSDICGMSFYRIAQVFKFHPKQRYKYKYKIYTFDNSNKLKIS